MAAPCAFSAPQARGLAACGVRAEHAACPSSARLQRYQAISASSSGKHGIAPRRRAQLGYLQRAPLKERAVQCRSAADIAPLGHDLLKFLIAFVVITPLAKKVNVNPILGFLTAGLLLRLTKCATLALTPAEPRCCTARCAREGTHVCTSTGSGAPSAIACTSIIAAHECHAHKPHLQRPAHVSGADLPLSVILLPAHRANAAAAPRAARLTTQQT